jgi:hypothetical protein
MNREWQGKKIGIPAIYSGIPIDTYHSDCCIEVSISSSGLRKIISKSPAHYWADSYYNARRIEKPEPKETPAFIIGRAAHHLLLGEADFDRLFIERPETLNGKDWQPNRKDCRDWVKARKSEGFTVLKAGDINRIRGMSDALARHPIIQAGILNGNIERSMIYKDQETGVWVKVRPDATPTDSLDFADLKTTTSIHWEDLMRSIGEFGYHQQAALTGTACQMLLKQPMQSFSFVFVESKDPYCIRVVSLKDHMLKLGEKMNRFALNQFAACWKAKKWPGPADDQADVQPIEATEWQIKKMEGQLKYGE